MSSAANKLKQARAYRGTAINRMSEMNDLAQNCLNDDSLRLLFGMRHEHINLIYDDFNEHHGTILSLLALQDSEEMQEEEAIRSKFDTNYYAAQAMYHTLFKKIENPAPQAAVKQTNIKLPKINIPVFNGNISNWPTFFGLYKSLIHENKTLSNSEKFQYLLSSLDKEPLLLIKNIPISNENYEIAFDNLYKRYQNTRILATHYWDKITDAPKLNTDSPKALRQLVDTFTDNITALKNLKYPIESWDFVLFRTLIRKLDSETIKRFELQNGSSEDPTYEQLIEFILKQCSALDSASMATTKCKMPTFQKQSVPERINSHASLVTGSTNTKSCSLCNEGHLIYTCPIFNSKSPRERFELVKQNNWCTNCLGKLHTLKGCNSNSACRICKSRHHSLLHFDRNVKTFGAAVPPVVNTPQTSSNQISEPIASTSQINSLSNVLPSNSTVLLSTAQVEILDSRGHYQVVRALLDCASQASFITEKCAHRLGLSRSKVSLSVCGVGPNMSSMVSSSITCTIKPKDQLEPVYNIDAFTLPKICSDMPTTKIPIQNWSHISNLKLADSHFNIASPIDMLLGADLFPLILRNGRLTGTATEPSAINTIFGWILMGKFDDCMSSPLINSFITICDTLPLESTIKRFWELEAVPEALVISPDDTLCEELYVNSYVRDKSGRFIVSLPFRNPSPSFNNSRSQTILFAGKPFAEKPFFI